MKDICGKFYRRGLLNRRDIDVQKAAARMG